MKTERDKTTNNVAGRRCPCASLLLTTAAIFAYFAPGVSQAWAYERGTGLGEVWRYLSCHWAHWNGEHLFWSAGVFFVLSVAAEDIDRHLYGVCVFISALLIPIGLKYWAPEVTHYGGLSGIDSALFGLLAVSIARDAILARRWTGAIAVGLFGIGFAAKITYEMTTGAAAFVSATAEMVPVPLAHVLGVVSGVFIGLVGQSTGRFFSVFNGFWVVVPSCPNRNTTRIPGSLK